VPFTISHTIAAPLLRRVEPRLVLPAAVIAAIDAALVGVFVWALTQRHRSQEAQFG
jgi:hypothetical protein